MSIEVGRERDWEVTLRERVAERARRRAARATVRQEQARRRAHGMIDRHAGRLARVRARCSPAEAVADPVTHGDTG